MAFADMLFAVQYCAVLLLHAACHVRVSVVSRVAGVQVLLACCGTARLLLLVAIASLG